MRSLAVSFVAICCVGCPDEVPAPRDEDPPETVATVTPPTGEPRAFVDGLVVLNTVEATVLVDANEPAVFHYTTDGSEPVRGGAGVGIARNGITLLLSEDTVLRWFAEDLSGNVEDPKRVELRFDREAPTLTVEPAGGEFAGAVDVSVSADEAGTLHWTTHGVSPVPGADRTRSAAIAPDAPVVITLRADATLRLLVEDAVGNTAESDPLVFIIDDTPPLTMADPPEGHYLTPVEVRLRADDPEARIHFTTDGSDPDLGSPIWQASQRVEAALQLRFRGVDAGGNLEVVREARYLIGQRADVGAGVVQDDGLTFDFEGGLWLAAALLDGAGLLSGTEHPGFRRDWAAWAVGRSAVDAALLQSGVGVHALRGPGHAEAAAAAGQPLGAAFADRLERLAAAAGASLPAGLYPVGLVYRQAGAALLQTAPSGQTVDGRPEWEEDFGALRWEGARASGRVVTPGSTAAALRALAARGRSATITAHPRGEDAWAAVAAPVLSLRCGVCHRRGGAEPSLSARDDYAAAGLLDLEQPQASRVLALLSGEAPHHGDRAPPVRVARVRGWIEDGAVALDDAAAVGTSAREGLMGLVALDALAHSLRWLGEALFFEPDTRALAPTGEGRWVVAEAAVTEAAGEDGLPRLLDSLQAGAARFDTRGHGRLARALSQVAALAGDRPALFAEGGPLADRPGVPTAPGGADVLLGAVLEALDAWGERATGGYQAARDPDGPDGDLDTLATAEAIMALRGAGMNANTAVRGLIGLRDRRGDYHGARGDGGVDSARPLLAVQMTVLAALIADGVATGDLSPAETLWARLDQGWWDPGAGMWQTTLGVPQYAYSPDVAARVVDALLAAEAVGLPGAAARLATFFDRVIVGGLLVSEGWLSGELSADDDSDGDGVPGLGGVGPDGAAPVFYRAVIW